MNIIEWLNHETTKFWIAVSVGIAIKFSFSERDETLTREEAVRRNCAGIVGGAACAFYGADHVARTFSIDPESYLLVVIGLVLTGEHFIKALLKKGPAIASAVIRKVFGVDDEKDDRQ